jgi:hypothetical protein
MTSTWRSLIPVALHVATIFTFNTIYRSVATRLTKWENHQTQLAFSNSLILKRFLFEAFDCYVALFYLAFYERNIDKLRSELISVFNIDTLRRLALECCCTHDYAAAVEKTSNQTTSKNTRRPTRLLLMCIHPWATKQNWMNMNNSMSKFPPYTY